MTRKEHMFPRPWNFLKEMKMSQPGPADFVRVTRRACAGIGGGPCGGGGTKIGYWVHFGPN